VTLMDDRDVKDLEDVRVALRKCAEAKDPREMWFLLRDTLNLLTMIIVPEPPVPGMKNPIRATSKKSGHSR